MAMRMKAVPDRRSKGRHAGKEHMKKGGREGGDRMKAGKEGKGVPSVGWGGDIYIDYTGRGATHLPLFPPIPFLYS
jgi:hypothetical protein